MTRNIHDNTYRQALRQLIGDGVKDSRNRWVKPDSTPTCLSFNRQNGFFYLTTANVVWGQTVRSMMSFVQGHVPYESNPKANFLDRVFDKAQTQFGTRRNFFRWGNVYGGYQDQIQDVIDGLKNDPLKTHVITNWDPSFIRRLPEPPSTTLLHFVCQPRSVGERIADNNNKEFNLGEAEYKLSLYVTNLSQDLYRTLPEYVAFYGLLLELVASDVEMTVDSLEWIVNRPYIHDSDLAKARERVKKPSNPPASFSVYQRRAFKDFQPSDLGFKVEQRLV